MNEQQAAQQNLSPSISTSALGRSLDGEEMLYLASLPDELVKQLSSEEALLLVKEDPKNWPQELKNKLRPYADEEMLAVL